METGPLMTALRAMVMESASISPEKLPAISTSPLLLSLPSKEVPGAKKVAGTRE